MEDHCIKRQSVRNADGSSVDMPLINKSWCLYDDKAGCRSVDLDVSYHLEEEDYAKSSTGSDKIRLVSLAQKTISPLKIVLQLHPIVFVSERRA